MAEIPTMEETRWGRLRKRLRRPLIVLTLVALAFALAIFWLVSTQSGTRFLLGRLDSFLPDGLDLGTPSGTLAGPLELEGLSFDSDTARATVAKLRLDWRLSGLLARRLVVDELRVETVRVTLLEAEEAEEPAPVELPGIELPVALRWRAEVLDIAVFDASEAELGRLARLRFTGNAAGSRFEIAELAAEGISPPAPEGDQAQGEAAPRARLAVRGQVETRGAYPLALDLSWGLEPATASVEEGDVTAFSGSGTLTGELGGRLEIDHKTTEPFPSTLEAHFEKVLTEGTFEALLTLEHLDLADLQLSEEGSASGRLEASGTFTSFIAEGDFELDSAEIGPGRGTLKLEGREQEGTLATLALSTLELTFPGLGISAPDGERPAVLSLEGEAFLNAEPLRFEGTARWSGLAWPQAGGVGGESSEIERTLSPVGSLHISGSPEDYRLEGSAEVAGSLPAGHWQWAGRGSPSGLDLESFEGETLGGTVQVSGPVTWSPAPAWDLRLRADGISPGSFWPEWPGRVGLAANLGGSLAGEDLRARLDIEALSGALRGQALAGGGAARVEIIGGDLREVVFDELSLALGQTRLDASGRLSDESDLEFQLRAPDLASTFPGARGSVAAEGTVLGSRRSPRVKARIEAAGLVFDELRAARVDGELEIDSGEEATGAAASLGELVRRGRLAVRLEAAELSWPRSEDLAEIIPARLARLTVEGGGPFSEHRLAIRAFGSGGSEAEEPALDIELAGGLFVAEGKSSAEELRWEGELRSLGLVGERLAAGTAGWLRELGSWGLEEPARLSVDAASASLTGFCWRGGEGGDGRLCLDGSWRDGDGDGEVALSAIPLELAAPWLPPEIELTGSLAGEAKVRLSGEDLFADLEMRVAEGGLAYLAESGEEVSFGYTAAANGRIGESGTDLEVEVALARGDAGSTTEVGTLAARLALPAWTSVGAPPESQSLEGELRVRFDDLSPFLPLAPDLTSLGGRLNVDTRLAGSVSRPEVVGTAKLSAGAAELPALGLSISDAELVVEGREGGALDLGGSLSAGGGRLELSGGLESPASPLKIQLRGEGIEIRPLPKSRLTVSPDLELELSLSDALPELAVRGEVRVPKAKIELQAPPATLAAASPDVVYVRGEPDAAAAPEALALRSRLRLILGDEVEVEGFGFTGRPTGSLLILAEPGRPQRGTGELQILEGRYRALGQDLALERGRLIFGGGALDNPGLDLKAFRRADDGVVAGLEIGGTLQIPETRLYSEPAMGQSEALAYLLLGRPIGAASSSDGDLLAQGAMSLGLKGGNFLAEKLAARFGLDEVSIESDRGLDQAALVVGAYLSPRLWVAYGVGLFEPVNTLRLRYLLSSKWTLQAESGAETSGDFLYRIER